MWHLEPCGHSGGQGCDFWVSVFHLYTLRALAISSVKFSLMPQRHNMVSREEGVLGISGVVSGPKGPG